MTNEQWKQLLAVLEGEVFDPLPAAFIIDSPWLPNWAGMTIMDYYASETKWLEANLLAIETSFDSKQIRFEPFCFAGVVVHDGHACPVRQPRTVYDECGRQRIEDLAFQHGQQLFPLFVCHDWFPSSPKARTVFCLL